MNRHPEAKPVRTLAATTHGPTPEQYASGPASIGARLCGLHPLSRERCDDTPLSSLFDSLRSTGRGKHVGPFSYYHRSVVERVPSAAAHLDSIWRRFNNSQSLFNVIKLDRGYRVSFLHYEDFSQPFPALLSALSCDLGHQAARATTYARRSNPPILHRKELLLCENDPLVRQAVDLTARLEKLGAFRETRTIGTRLGWRRRLADIGVQPDGSQTR